MTPILTCYVSGLEELDYQGVLITDESADIKIRSSTFFSTCSLAEDGVYFLNESLLKAL